ncbi:hypothetical protein [Nocardioides nitrophenolicus]|uniref:hypothetical protein n=1 Tax=Nocardioides nitrophenolicus TaxID=60489 RepID=UPI00195D4675|nr:hypothetical protein [Nocardioides nitrophenolicus]MBM7518320.1 hypothetical protein [Nocardioides nitrophenolicus]
MEQRRIVPLRVVALALLAGLLAATAAWGWAQHRSHEHLGTATIMLHPLEGNAYSPGGRGDDLVNLETEAQVLRSDTVARAVLDQLHEGGTPADLLAAVTVSVPPNTQLLQITARGPDDATAVARASAFGDVFLKFRRSRTESAVYEQTSRLEELVKNREDERDAAVAHLDQLRSDAPERALIQQQVQEVVVQISSLRAQLAAAQAVALDPGQVVTPGQVVGAGLWGSPGRVGGLAGALAAVLVLAIAVVRRTGAAPDVVRHLDDLDTAGPTVLGELWTPVRADSDVIAHARSVVLAVGSDRPPVVAVGAVAGGTSIAFPALVDSFVRARYEVVAVDLTRRADRQAMAELVLQDAVVADVLVEDGHFRNRLRPLDVPTDGPDAAPPDGLDDLAASAEMRRSLAELAKRADLVLLRSPGLGTTVGRAVLAASTVVVAEVTQGTATQADLATLAADVERAGSVVAGLILTHGREDES